MPTATYCRLIDEVCRLSLLSTPHTLYEHAALRIDGVDISLVERHEPVAEVAIHCDLGPLPDRQREAALHRLLEINFHLSVGAANSTCAVNPKTGHAILAAAISLHHARATQLLQLLGQLAGIAIAWRQSFFLAPQPRPSADVNRSTMR